MKLVELSMLYALLGVGGAVAVALRPRGTSDRWLDALLMLAFWPLYAPFVFWNAAPATGVASTGEIAFLTALRRAAGTPLAALLPDEASARALGRRLRVAASKLREIDELLRRQDFDEDAALRRSDELEQRGASPPALSAASLRLHNIRRLRALRDRFARELLELEELLAQLTTQAEVVRLAGVPDTEVRDLVREILSRVEGLDAVLDEGAEPLDVAAEGRY